MNQVKKIMDIVHQNAHMGALIKLEKSNCTYSYKEAYDALFLIDTMMIGMANQVFGFEGAEKTALEAQETTKQSLAKHFDSVGMLKNEYIWRPDESLTT